MQLVCRAQRVECAFADARERVWRSASRGCRDTHRVKLNSQRVTHVIHPRDLGARHEGMRARPSGERAPTLGGLGNREVRVPGHDGERAGQSAQGSERPRRTRTPRGPPSKPNWLTLSPAWPRGPQTLHDGEPPRSDASPIWRARRQNRGGQPSRTARRRARDEGRHANWAERLATPGSLECSFGARE